jgi:hypothetical protein
MAQNEELISIETEGWTRGFLNLFRTELGLWKNTKKWWIQIILWLMAINLLLIAVVGAPVLAPENFEDDPTFVPPTISEGILFYILFSLFPMLAVIVLMQGVIVFNILSKQWNIASKLFLRLGTDFSFCYVFSYIYLNARHYF